MPSTWLVTHMWWWPPAPQALRPGHVVRPPGSWVEPGSSCIDYNGIALEPEEDYSDIPFTTQWLDLALESGVTVTFSLLKGSSERLAAASDTRRTYVINYECPATAPILQRVVEVRYPHRQGLKRYVAEAFW